MDDDGNLYIFYEHRNDVDRRMKLNPANDIEWDYESSINVNYYEAVAPRPLPDGDMLYLNAYEGYYDDGSCEALRINPEGEVVDSVWMELNSGIKAWEFAYDGFVYAHGSNHYGGANDVYLFNPLTTEISWHCSINGVSGEAEVLSAIHDGSGIMVAGNSPDGYMFLASVRQNGSLFWVYTFPAFTASGLFCTQHYTAILFSSSGGSMVRYGSFLMGGQLDWFMPLNGMSESLVAVAQSPDEGYVIAVRRDYLLHLYKLAGVKVTVANIALDPPDDTNDGVLTLDLLIETGEVRDHNVEVRLQAEHVPSGELLPADSLVVSLTRNDELPYTMYYTLPAGSQDGDYKLLIDLQSLDGRYSKQSTSDFNLGATAVAESNPTANSFTLFDVYPNPFNSSTMITLKLKHSTRLAVKLFNVNGQVVRNLQDAQQTVVGVHRIELDGSQLPSGIYFAVVSDDRTIQAHKLILLR